MTQTEALRELLERVEASQGAALVSEEELRRWPVEAVRAMKTHRLLVKASPATTGICLGCEQECTMPVQSLLSAGTGDVVSFIVCDKRDDINRVPVPSERLRQWRCGVEAVGTFVARSLGLRAENQRKADAGLWELGLLKGNKRSQMVCLRACKALELVAGNQAVPLVELVSFGAEGYSVDGESIRQLVDAANTGDFRYTPSHARSEARKLETQSIYELWRKEYRTLKTRRPEMSDVWYSQKLASMGISHGRRAETIRKHMKR